MIADMGAVRRQAPSWVRVTQRPLRMSCMSGTGPQVLPAQHKRSYTDVLKAELLVMCAYRVPGRVTSGSRQFCKDLWGFAAGIA